MFICIRRFPSVLAPLEYQLTCKYPYSTTYIAVHGFKIWYIINFHHQKCEKLVIDDWSSKKNTFDSIRRNPRSISSLNHVRSSFEF